MEPERLRGACSFRFCCSSFCCGSRDGAGLEDSCWARCWATCSVGAGMEVLEGTGEAGRAEVVAFLVVVRAEIGDMTARLSNVDRIRIAEAVVEAEEKTRGEIVPLLVRASDDYPGARWRLAVSVGLLVGMALVMIWPGLDSAYVLLGVASGMVVGHALAFVRPILRWVLTKREVDEEVRQRAREAFLELNLHATQERTGVLVMISLLERRIEIVSDRGIEEHVPEGFWAEVIQAMTVPLRHRDVATGLVMSVERVGALLAREFPATGPRQNALPDDVVVQ